MPDDGDAEADAKKKKRIPILPSNIAIFQICWLVWKPVQTKYVVPAINSKRKYGKLAVVALVVQITQNLAISPCCFVKDDCEM